MKKGTLTYLSFNFVFGFILGIFSKYLDTASIDGSWWSYPLSYLGDLFTRLGIWVLLAVIIAAYSKSIIFSAINTFLFFLGMLVSYYTYSAFLFGFFPLNYFFLWGSIALASPFLAMLVWSAKHHHRLSILLSALPLGLILNLSLGLGLFYVYLKYIEEFIMFLILCVIFYKNPKQIAIVIILSVVVAVLFQLVSPFHF
ncbi:hypothetical protein [Alkalihalobacillus trypoxylicola]|uniref:Uncharacterized protein n=1 Tax=Alkalihalobacillus trypoxylicola TaxID=519424 RepID=A0A162EP23_9BACI|nr:hypothetical protein [Alkalihalobacillus trypoxylicola]KYG33382.1 hypothetical protein AZF04_16850 [Alkalihalobacillus trypoxylicola]